MLLLLFIQVINGNDDIVSEIPYYTGNKVNFETYSGYLNGDSGALFYLFTQSSSSLNPENDPLVLWLNGGPGCSSMMGQFIEFGPYHPYNYGDNIEYNEFSWNNFANILFLESPPCVGFSYPYSMNCHSYKTNDNQTKWDNYIALQDFFKKYPSYLENEFLITGESYAGHYVPQLADLIIKQNKLSLIKYSYINLKGIAIGNPYINRDNNWFKGWIPTMYNYGIINNQIKQKLLSKQCKNATFNKECSEYSSNFIWDYLNDINVYDINVRSNCSKRSRQESQLLRHIYSSNNFVDNLKDGNIWSYPYTPCNEPNLIYYLNSYDVWDAFHVNKDWMNSNGNINNNTWQVCSWYFKGYDINQTDDKQDQIKYIKNILTSSDNIRILIYSGNNDLVCAYSGTRYWIYNKLNKTQTGNIKTNWTKWHINGEVAGWYQLWDKLSFVVVKDAGHEVPEYQPIRAYSLFKRFINNDYNDIPINIQHSDWNNYYTNNQQPQHGKYIAIGVVIGIFVSFIIGLFIFAFIWIKRNNYLEKIIKNEKNLNSHVILESENENEIES